MPMAKPLENAQNCHVHAVSIFGRPAPACDPGPARPPPPPGWLPSSASPQTRG